MRTPLSISVFLLAVTLASSSAAADFEAAFTPENTSALSADARIMVVAVGPDTTDATSRLAQALRNTPGTQLVMDGAALGDVSHKSDDDIFQAAAAYPVDGVIVVRVFEAAEGKRVAVLSYRGRDGARRSASVMSDQSLEPTTVTATTKAPIVVKNVEDPSKVKLLAAALAHATDLKAAAVAVLKSAELRRGMYQRQFVHFGPTQWEAYRGAFNDPLYGSELYNAIQEPQLAEAYDSADALRTGMLVGGGVAVALGIGLVFVSIPGETDIAGVVGGSTSIGIGAAAMLWGLLTDSHPVSDPEARTKTNKYNQKLRRELGLE